MFKNYFMITNGKGSFDFIVDCSKRYASVEATDKPFNAAKDSEPMPFPVLMSVTSIAATANHFSGVSSNIVKRLIMDEGRRYAISRGDNTLLRDYQYDSDDQRGLMLEIPYSFHVHLSYQAGALMVYNKDLHTETPTDVAHVNTHKEGYLLDTEIAPIRPGVSLEDLELWKGTNCKRLWPFDLQRLFWGYKATCYE